MKRIINIAIVILASFFLTSCIEERLEPMSALKEGEGWLEFSFGAPNSLEVSTKATQTVTTESQVYNFYLFIFDSAGHKIYGKNFDNSNIKTGNDYTNSTEDCWNVTNTTSDTGTTRGNVKVKAPAGSGLKLYMLVNLDADMVKISSDLLANTISNEADLLKFNVFLNQTIVNRNAYFPMSGKLTNITIEGNTLSSPNGNMILKRLDAKVRFIFKTGDRTDERGQRIQKFEAKSWKVVNVPRTAYVMDYYDRGLGNDPTSTGRDHGAVDCSTIPIGDYSNYAANFFETGFVNFEDYTKTTSEFSFYMLENRQTPKQIIPEKSESNPKPYQERSRQIKESTGLNQECTVNYVVNGVPIERNMKIFENANDFSTYVLVKGEVSMKLNDDSAGQTLNGDVQYLIHLGDWNSTINAAGPGDGKDTYTGFNNYNTLRNTSYTYTVTVNSVDNIRVEVESNNGIVQDTDEGQPGATGDVTIAKEDIALCDCHYASKTLTFHLKNYFENNEISEEACIVDDLTWRVDTPFSVGSPIREGDIDITDGLDYKWVRFRLNKMDSGSYYSDKRRKFTPRVFASSSEWRTAAQNMEGDGTEGLAGYHNDGCMDVVALVKYMKEQVKRYLVNPDDSDFDNGYLVGGEVDEDGPKICVTVFVDEYYYTEHPLTGSREDPHLWKRFVNQDDRSMHILCNSDVSLDYESRATGSVITIKQKAIQTIYNDDPDYTALNTAWGLENEDEYTGKWTYWKDTSGGSRGNTDLYNGLLNTCREWGLCANNNTNFINDTYWGTYMDIEVNNDNPQLHDGDPVGTPEYDYLRYSCMTRNRDNNGDGKIDRDEVRWYMASIRQLIGLFVGEGVVDPSARLYNRNPDQISSTNENDWMQHVISSTASAASSSNLPTIVWAEEGISTGGYRTADAAQKLTVRCVRNLGYIGGTDGGSPETYNIGLIPDDYIVKEPGTGDDSHIFTTTHLNENALRYYTSRELPFADQNSIENRLYKKFAVYKQQTTYDNNMSVSNFNNNITNDISNGKKNRYCPEGYRTPNQRELAIMVYYFTNETGYTNDFIEGNYITRTYWSFGPEGKLETPKHDTKQGFAARTGPPAYTTVSQNTSYNGTRCVRDIRVD